MTPIHAWLATYALHSTVLLGAVALGTALAVKRDAWRDTLWKAALLGGFVTTTLQLNLGIRPLVGRVELGVAKSATPVTGEPATVPTAVLRGLEIERGTPFESQDRPAILTQRNRGYAERHAGTPWPWPSLLLAMWGAGAGGLLVRVARRQLRLHRLLRDRRDVRDERVLAILTRLRRNAGLWRPVRLSSTPRCSTPLALGTSEICVPDRLLGTLAPDEQRAALAHELAHLARHDPLWQLVAGVLEAVFFFQPLNQLARRRLREAAEHLCDDWAVRQTGSAIGLARCLAAVASWVTPDAEPVRHATLAMAEGGSPLLKRVERLLAGGLDGVVAGPRTRSAVAVGLVVLVLGAAPVVSQHGGASPPTAPSPSARSARDVGPAQSPVQVRRHPDPSQPFDRRYAWALAEGRRHGEREYWVAYVLESVLPARHRYATDSDARRDVGALPTLGQLLFEPTWHPDDPSTDRDVVVLARVRAAAAGSVSLVRIAGRSPALEVELGGLTIYCLGPGDDAASIAFLESLRRETSNLALRKTLIDLVAIHHDRERVVPILLDVLEGGDGADVRGAAAEGLARHPSASVLARLRRAAFEDRSDRVRAEAAEALGETGAEDAVAVLEEIIRRAPSIQARLEAVEALGGFRRPDVLDKLVGIASNGSDQRVQLEAVETIAEANLPEAGPVLERIAREHPQSAVRGKALESLARWRDHFEPGPNPNPNYDPGNLDPGNVDPDSVDSGPSDPDDSPRAERLPVTAQDISRARVNAERFADGPDGPAVRRLAAALGHEPLHDADLVRDRATWALSRMERGAVVAPLVAALGDEDRRVRAYAAWALEVTEDQRAAVPLREALRDSHWRVRAHAAYGIGTLADRQSTAELARLLLDARWHVRVAAAESLERIGDPAAIPALRRALGDVHVGVRDAAASALVRLGRT
ncbi:MAG TPA: HEAT repeat domain-containing protein [Gemmatimonadales bacterium]|nr:HEAT repeat domain-containing protein [Gemmatimonadales bacterium]